MKALGTGRSRGIAWTHVEVRNGQDALVKLSDKMKAQGYQSVSWGAVGTGYWIGETFQPAN